MEQGRGRTFSDETYGKFIMVVYKGKIPCSDEVFNINWPCQLSEPNGVSDYQTSVFQKLDLGSQPQEDEMVK